MIDYSKDKLLTEQAKELLKNFYYKENESSPQDVIYRAANAFCFGDFALRDRIYTYVSNNWAWFASPIASNAPKGDWAFNTPYSEKYFWEDSYDRLHHFSGKPSKNQPISCFLTYVPDTIEGQIDAAKELAWLSVIGGGVGQHLGMRGITDKAPGAIPYLKTSDANIMYYQQGSTRRGAVAAYLDISHPDIVEFIGVRNPTGGDFNRKSLNVNIAVNVTDAFLEAVRVGKEWNLICPHTKNIVNTVKARELWQSILDTRFKTGEPYIHYIDEANRHLPQHIKDAGFAINGSNLCIEIELITSPDYTAVCCLSSLNLEFFDEWKDTNIVEDFTRFLDNVLQYFIDTAPDNIVKAKNSARDFRDLGLGMMGFHSLLQRKGIPFESGGNNSAAQLSHQTAKLIKTAAIAESIRLGIERGLPKYNNGKRNNHLMAIAPNANNSVIANCSPSIEPIKANAYTHRTRAGSHVVKNKYLVPILEKYSKNDKDTWYSITTNEGSVQHLDFLSDEERKIFKTANEIDQLWVVELARIRQPFICQGQSVNLFFKAGVSKKYVHQVHMSAFMKDGPGQPLKGLYYLRSTKQNKLKAIGTAIVREALADYETQATECLSCHG